jgi:hypothetical protein
MKDIWTQLTVLAQKLETGQASAIVMNVVVEEMPVRIALLGGDRVSVTLGTDPAADPTVETSAADASSFRNALARLLRDSFHA